MDPQYRDLCAESVFEYGSRAGIWRVERMLTQYKIPITFFACAVALERNREVGAWLREAGHEPCCHGWRWEEVWRLSRQEEAEHIRLAIDSIKETCGERPLGWYCRYGPSVNTRELIVEEGGFIYDSDAYNDDLPYFVDVKGKQHLVVPYSMTYNDGKFGLLPAYGSPADFLDNLKRGLDQLWDEGASHPRMMSIGLHPRLIGQASRIHALREFIEYALKKGGVWFCRRIDIARWWLDHHAEFNI
jgi:peptidoglycan/xylan/chitin deacetylase (PgdA/CDA1 family)